MIVFCNGNKINLTQNEFLSSGGEGEIYNKSNTIYKIYFSKIDSKKENKLKQLSILNKKNIIAPKEVLYSTNNEAIGYTMSFVDNASSLALLFTNSFKKRNNISEKHLESIFLNMSETIKFIHDKEILIVDGNELNYLISNKDWSTPYFIDVDGYQTKDSPTTAIMPSIQDFLNKDFTKNSDWYSFAVLMFQLYTGIHPYKGTHPKYKKDDIVSRCKDKISVFNKDVSYPPFVNLNIIPSNLNDWFVRIFEKGERLLPPNLIINNAPAPQTTKNYTTKIIKTLYKSFDEKINRFFFISGVSIFSLESKYIINNNTILKKNKNELFIIDEGNIISITKESDKYKFHNEKNSVIVGDKMSIINNRIFVLKNNLLLEYELNKFSKTPTFKSNWNVLSSIKFYGNCLYMNSFGKAVFYIPETNIDKKLLHIIKIKELDNNKIIDVYYENNTLIAISLNKIYYKSVVKFDDLFQDYKIFQEECSLQEINATVIPNGMSVILNDCDLELSAKNNTDRKLVDANIDLQLTHISKTIYGYKDNEIFQLSMS